MRRLISAAVVLLAAGLTVSAQDLDSLVRREASVRMISYIAEKSPFCLSEEYIEDYTLSGNVLSSNSYVSYGRKEEKEMDSQRDSIKVEYFKYAKEMSGWSLLYLMCKDAGISLTIHRTLTNIDKEASFTISPEEMDKCLPFGDSRLSRRIYVRNFLQKFPIDFGTAYVDASKLTLSGLVTNDGKTLKKAFEDTDFKSVIKNGLLWQDEASAYYLLSLIAGVGFAYDNISVLDHSRSTFEISYDDLLKLFVEVAAVSPQIRPKFLGNESGSFATWIADNLRYPKEARRSGIEGTVVVQFIIGADGSVTNVKAREGSDPALGAEAVRVVSKSPDWTPGQRDGKPVAVNYSIPVVFMKQN